MIKNWKSFLGEKLTYLEVLKKQKEISDEYNNIENREENKELPKLKKHYIDRKKEDEIFEERKIIVNRVIEGILSSEKGKSDFKEKLLHLLKNSGF